MSREDFKEIIAVIQNDIKYIVKAIDEFKEQNNINYKTHSDIYNRIEEERKNASETYCTKEQYLDTWTTVKAIVAFSIAQVIALVFLLISKVL